MNILPHVYVVPVTGPNEGRGVTCYVCQLGSAPVIAAFIKPNYSQLLTYFETVQKLFEKHSALQAFIVILSGPDENLMQTLREIANEQKLTVPLTVLDPEAGLPESLPINREADVTVLLYRGRHVEKVVEILPHSTPKVTDFVGDAESHVIQKSLTAATPLEHFKAFPTDEESASLATAFDEFDTAKASESSAVFNELDAAATELISRQ